MKLRDVQAALGAKVLCCEDKLEREVQYAFASDLMSDVLTIPTDDLLLLTGLANLQAIRTAEMSDIGCIVFVRNKRVSPEMVELARETGIVLMECPTTMYRASGLLFQQGLKAVY